MSDDLVKRLREPYEQRQSRRVAEEFDAADRIEALTADLAAAQARADALAEKLEKAVDGLRRAAKAHREIAGFDLIGASATAYNAAREAESTLAQITGGKTDDHTD